MIHIKHFDNFLNESTVQVFEPRVIPAEKRLDADLFASLMPKSAETSREAERRIFQFARGTMFVHYQYFRAQPRGDRDSKTYRINQNQYWLNDYQLKIQGRDPNESVNVTLLHIYDEDDKLIGMAYVDTRVFLAECGEVFYIKDRSS